MVIADEKPPGESFQVQTGEVEVSGFEVEFVGRFRERLSLNAALTWTDSEVTRSNGPDLGAELPVVPGFQASALADYTIQEGTFKGLGLGLGARYRGTHWGDANRTLSVPSFLLFDASLHYQWEGLKFGLHARNLLDKYHVGSCYYRNSAGICTAGEPLTVMANMSYQW